MNCTRTRFLEPVQKNAFLGPLSLEPVHRNAFTKTGNIDCEMGKLSQYARRRIINLRFTGKSVSEITRKIRDEDGIVTSRPAVSLFLKRYNETGSLCDRPRKGRKSKLVIQHFDAIDEEMKANDELSALELARILQVRFDIDVSPQTVRRVRRKLGWRWSGTKYCQLVKEVNKPKRMQHCLNILDNQDDFSDVIFTDECSVKIERYTRRSFHKVGEQRRSKGQPKHPLKVLCNYELFVSVNCISLFGHNVTSTTLTIYVRCEFSRAKEDKSKHLLSQEEHKIPGEERIFMSMQILQLVV